MTEYIIMDANNVRVRYDIYIEVEIMYTLNVLLFFWTKAQWIASSTKLQLTQFKNVINTRK